MDERDERLRLGALARAQAELEAGRAWRAKEILRGSLANPSQAADPELLEFFGALLDRLGDRLEAGKLLYLSGRRAERYDAAIALFLERSERLPGEQFVALFPKAIRFQGLGCLPEIVRRDLAERGVSDEDLARDKPISIPVEEDAGGGAAVGVAIGIGCLVLLASSSFLGCVTVLRWIF